MKKEYLTANFTFSELTATTKAVDENGDGFLSKKEKKNFRALNKKNAIPFKGSLTKVCEQILQPCRDYFGVSVTVNSGFRGRELNKLVGGSPRSQHCYGQAADFNVRGKRKRQGQIDVIAFLIQHLRAKGQTWGQILLERGCVHASTGTKCEVAEYSVSTKTKKIIPELSQFPGI